MSSTIARAAVVNGGSSSTSGRAAKLGYHRYGRMLPFALMGLLIASFWLPSNLVNAADLMDVSYYDQYYSTETSVIIINGNLIYITTYMLTVP